MGQNNHSDAYEMLTKANKEFLGYFEKESNPWALPVFILLIRQLREVATASDKLATGNKSLEDCAVQYRQFFKVANNKPMGLLPVIIGYLSFYFKLKSYQKCNEMIRHVVSGKTPPLHQHPIS